MSFTILPAVDLLQGQAVQLVQGVLGSEQQFGDPLAAARRWREEGAEWLHVVDLDAAFGRGDNAAVAARIVAESGLQVELTGGLRDQAGLDRALGTGCARVNLGTAALEHPDWAAAAIAQDPERVAIALDVLDGQIAARGWTTAGGSPEQAVARFTAAGCRRFVVTAVASDGMLQGPDLALLERVAGLTDAKLTASGGISSLDDLRALMALGPAVDSAIVGTALYLGRFRLAEALSLTA